MSIIGCRQRDARFPGQAVQLGQDCLLLPDAIIPVHKPSGDLPCQACGQTDQSLMILLQQFQIHPGLIVKALDVPQGYQLYEVLIAGLIPAQQHQVIGTGIQPMHLVMAAPGGYIHLTADDGLDTSFLRRLPEFHCPVHAAVIGDRHRSLPQFLDALYQLLDAARPIQQAVFRMHMQMHKIRHKCSLLRLGAQGICKNLEPLETVIDAGAANGRIQKLPQFLQAQFRVVHPQKRHLL